MRRYKQHSRTFFLFLLGAVILLPLSAFAHRVNLFAYLERGRIYTESYFSNGQPAQGKIKVFDNSNDTLLLEGENDKEGLFSFPSPPAVKTVRIILSAPMGHRCSYTLTISSE